jgi:uncharacterized integral membrane protein
MRVRKTHQMDEPLSCPLMKSVVNTRARNHIVVVAVTIMILIIIIIIIIIITITTTTIHFLQPPVICEPIA